MTLLVKQVLAKPSWEPCSWAGRPQHTGEVTITVSGDGEQVTFLSEEDDWYRIQAQDGALEGWIAKPYVDIDTGQQTVSSS